MNNIRNGLRSPAYWTLFFGSLWLAAEFILAGKFSVVRTAENGELFLPVLLGENFLTPGNSLWEIFANSGTDKQIFTFYGNLDLFLFTHLPGWLAHGLRVSSVYVIGLLSAYFLARRTFGFGEPASLFVAFAYTVPLDGTMIAVSLGYLPLLLLGIGRLLERHSDFKRWLLLAAVLYLYADTTYFSRIIPWTPGIVVFWFLFVDAKKGGRDWLIVFACCIALTLLRLDDLMALIANVPLSHITMSRGMDSGTEALIGLARGSIFFSSSERTASTLLFVFALIVLKGGDRQMKGVLAALLIGAVLHPLSVVVQNAVTEFFPIQGYRMGFVLEIPMFILAFAGGYGFQALIGQERLFSLTGNRRLLVWGCRLGLVMAVVPIAYMSIKSKYTSALNWVTQGSFAHNFESPVLKELSASVRSQPWPERVETFQIIPNYLHAYGIETTGGYHALHLLRYYEFWGKMAEPWASSLNPESYYYKMFAERRKTLEGSQAFRGDRMWMYPQEYRPEWRLGDLYRLNFLSLANVGHIVSRDRLTDDSLVPVREPGAPWSSLSRRDKTRINVRANFSGREHLYIYRNKDAFPRFFTVPNIKTFNSGKEVLEAMAEATIDDLRANLFVERDQLPESLSSGQDYAKAEIRLEHYSSDEIRLNVSAGGPSILILTNSFSPYWTCEIDGIETPIFPAYHTFWGVALPESAKSVVFRYQPPYR